MFHLYIDKLQPLFFFPHDIDIAASQFAAASMMRASPSPWAISPVHRMLRLPASGRTLQCQPSIYLHRQLCAPGAGVRYKSTEGALENGHIELGPNNGALFINNIAPLRLQWLFRLLPISESQLVDNILKRVDKPAYAASDHLTIVKRALPAESNIQVETVIPRLNEGGVFVKYTRRTDITDADVEGAVRDHLKKEPIRPWFNPFDQVQVGRVLGNPWIEDLYRFPSPKLKVEFLPSSSETAPVEMTQEALYTIFRKYGKLKDIEKQQASSPNVPKFAYLEFTRTKSAVLARSCVHGLKVPEKDGGGKNGTVLKITYERKYRGSWIKDWLFNHPRIVIPLLAALIATITVIIFDPIRTFCIKMKVKYLLNPEDKPFVEWIRRQIRRANSLVRRHKEDSGVLSTIWEDRKNDISQLQSWITENTSTFIVVQGPHGSGKRELVLDQALKDTRYKVVIDCKQIEDARGDAATISAAAAQVGYRPVFSWMNSISSFIDLASQGVIGTKAGFSETLDAQLNKIWQNTTVALKELALEEKKKDDKEGRLSEEEYMETHPERRPVVIIDNFMHRNKDESLVYDKVSEWAASLVSSNIAHVVFLTPDVSYSKSLSKALPNQVFRTISLGDCSLEVGKNFVMKYLEREGDSEKKFSQEELAELDECVATLGGRLTDLEFMAQRIKAGESPASAVSRIIAQSATETIKMYVFEVDPGVKHWTREQAWHVIKELAQSKDGVVPFDRIVLSDLFKTNGEATISALEQAELISVITVNGRAQSIKPGRPVLHAAFKCLTEDKVLKSRLDLVILTQLISDENKNVSKYENELQLLSSLPKQPAQIYSRLQWVLHKLQASQAKVDNYERQSNDLKKILQSQS